VWNRNWWIHLTVLAGWALAVSPIFAEEGDPFTGHTDPPIIIGKGGLVFYQASDEPPVTCSDAKPCATGLVCVDAPDAKWCAKVLQPDYKLFNDQGECSDVNRLKLDWAFLGKGIEGAKQKGGDKAHGRTYRLRGTDRQGNEYKLTLSVGDESDPNVIVLEKNRVPCRLQSTNSVEDVIPWEFQHLETLKRRFRDRVPLTFAACKKDKCDP